MPKHVLVVNDAAGSAEEEAVAAATAVLRRHGACEIARTADPEDVDDVVGRLDGEILVVAGGDGSLNVAMSALRRVDRLDVPVGVVPLGTGNDFAQGLGLPLDPEGAAQRIVEGSPRPLDLLISSDDDVCVNALHIGVGVDAAERASDLKDQFGPAAYPLGALVAGLAATGRAMTVEIDGTMVSDGQTLMVAVCNGPGFGGGTTVAPEAEPDDGRLDVVVVRAVGAGERAAFAAALVAGRHIERDDVVTGGGQSVVIGGDGLDTNVDGELRPRRGDAQEWRVSPGVARLIR